MDGLADTDFSARCSSSPWSRVRAQQEAGLLGFCPTQPLPDVWTQTHPKIR